MSFKKSDTKLHTVHQGSIILGQEPIPKQPMPASSPGPQSPRAITQACLRFGSGHHAGANQQTVGCHERKEWDKSGIEITGSLKIEWFDTKRAAAYLCLSVGALRNMTSNGQIPYYKLGKRNRYRLADLRELLFSQRKGKFYGN